MENTMDEKTQEEVTEEVITSSKSIVLKQAYNRKVIQKGLISWLNI